MTYLQKLQRQIDEVVAEGKFRIVKIRLHRDVIGQIVEELKDMLSTDASYPEGAASISGYPLEKIDGDDAPDWILDLEPLIPEARKFIFDEDPADWKFNYRLHWGIDYGSGKDFTVYAIYRHTPSS